MSDDRVSIVRDAYEEWNAAGVRAFVPSLADAIELHDMPQLPDAAEWRGVDAVAKRLQEVAQSVGGGSVELNDVRLVGDEVLVAMDWQLEHAHESASLGCVYHLVRVSGDKIDRIRVFLTEEDAVNAAG
jgi:hypothetical protein